VKIVKNPGGGWQLFFKTLAGKELRAIKVSRAPEQLTTEVRINST